MMNETKKMKVGLIGCGTIGSYLIEQIRAKPELGLEISVVCGRSEASQGREKVLEYGLTWTTDVSALWNSSLDVVIEAASHEALATTGVQCLENGLDLIPVSVGPLVDSDLLESLKEAAIKGGSIFHIPSGGIGGMDALQAANIAGVDKVSMTVRKTPRAWKSVPYVIRKGFELEGLKESLVLFEGPARDCVKEFPQDVNIAAVLSLAGIGFERTIIRIVADPVVSINKYDIEWEGAAGKCHIVFENTFAPANPKTTYLAALSTLATLKRIRASYRIGS